MSDGGVFDAEYYAQNNPDVVAAFGTDKELLYSHYVNCGKVEGRLAVAPEMPVATTQDTQVLATNELMEEVYSKVINISTTNMEEFYTYVAANFENIKNACTFVESKACPTWVDGIPVYTSYYYTYVAKDGQRLNMIASMGGTAALQFYGTSNVKEPSITIEFIVDPIIVDSTRTPIYLRTNKLTYEHYIRINDMNYNRNENNYYINGNRFCKFKTYTLPEGNREFVVMKEDEIHYLPEVYANNCVRFRAVFAGMDPNRVTYTN